MAVQDEVHIWSGPAVAIGGVLIGSLRWALGLHWRTQAKLAQLEADHATGLQSTAQSIQQLQSGQVRLGQDQTMIWGAITELRSSAQTQECRLAHIEGEHKVFTRGGVSCPHD